MAYLRRYAFAKTAYELRLHGRPASGIAPALKLLNHPETTQANSEAALRSLFQQLFSRALTFPLNDEESMRFRADVDDTFYSADYSRAFVLAGMIREGMRRKFGEDWYADDELGSFLRAQSSRPAPPSRWRTWPSASAFRARWTSRSPPPAPRGSAPTPTRSRR